MTSRRTPRRRQSSSSLGGIVGLVLGVGVIVLITLVAKNVLESRAESVTQPEPEQLPPRRGMEPSMAVTPSPDRPAPEFTGEVIIQADALFRDAKALHADALRAKEGGEPLAYQQGIEDCRSKLDQIESLLGDFTGWLAEAKQKDWSVPSTYDTLERRRARYGKLRAKLPPK